MKREIEDVEIKRELKDTFQNLSVEWTIIRGGGTIMEGLTDKQKETTEDGIMVEE